MNFSKRLLLIFGIMTATAVIFLILLIVAGRQGSRGAGYMAGSVLATKLAVSVHNQAAVNLPKVPNFDFEWDRVYFFSAYTPREVVEKRVGASLGWSWSSLTEVTEGYTLIVFKHRSRVVAFFDFPIEAGNFLPAAKVLNGFSAQEANFSVTRQPPNSPVLAPISR